MEFRVLGPLELGDGQRVVDIGGRRQRRLLAALLVQVGHVVPAGELVEVVWPDDDRPPGADRALRTYVSRLRQQLAEAGHDGPRVLRTETPGYRIDLDGNGLGLDANRFADLVNGCCDRRLAGEPTRAVEDAERALALWRGKPYAEFAEETWATAEVRRLEDLQLTAIEERLEALLELGRHAQVTPELERRCAEHPLRERLWRLHMVALYRDGRQADALRAFQDYRRTLAERTGLEPGAELRTLDQQIAAQAPTLMAPAPAAGPYGPTSWSSRWARARSPPSGGAPSRRSAVKSPSSRSGPSSPTCPTSSAASSPRPTWWPGSSTPTSSPSTTTGASRAPPTWSCAGSGAARSKSASPSGRCPSKRPSGWPARSAGRWPTPTGPGSCTGT